MPRLRRRISRSALSPEDGNAHCALLSHAWSYPYIATLLGARTQDALEVRLRGVCTERLYFIVLEFSTQVFWAGR